MPDFFQKFFRRQPVTETKATVVSAFSKEEKIARLQLLIAETLALYQSVACPCAFPRFRQIAGIDCVDYGESFYAAETELLIEAAEPFYDKKIIGRMTGNDGEWMCKTCGSLWHYNWQDFSLAVSRSVLKIGKLTTGDAGAPLLYPIPLYVGLTGHGYPPKSRMAPASLEDVKAYLQEKHEQKLWP